MPSLIIYEDQLKKECKMCAQMLNTKQMLTMINWFFKKDVTYWFTKMIENQVMKNNNII